MSSSRPVRAVAEGDRILVQLPGRPVTELTAAEAARLARQMLALGPVRDHEALEVARVLAEDQDEPGSDEDPSTDAIERGLAAQRTREPWGDG